ncbi:hypothetical protein CDD80_3943 [Ophiocordyceps camponoti-rufipedis]|uniref:Uncharacterized protein n=1 Tax=Ophiocordyceps camponoti-rufipedis TaxID=2004952 RepID=A0A2C5Z051_9HYPO|nr:hypothetical protein CDD80_3943 [Ophiocordyceps camponoti-rufipedis]
MLSMAQDEASMIRKIKEQASEEIGPVSLQLDAVTSIFNKIKEASFEIMDKIKKGAIDRPTSHKIPQVAPYDDFIWAPVREPYGLAISLEERIVRQQFNLLSETAEVILSESVEVDKLLGKATSKAKAAKEKAEKNAKKLSDNSQSGSWLGSVLAGAGVGIGSLFGAALGVGINAAGATAGATAGGVGTGTAIAGGVSADTVPILGAAEAIDVSTAELAAVIAEVDEGMAAEILRDTASGLRAPARAAAPRGPARVAEAPSLAKRGLVFRRENLSRWTFEATGPALERALRAAFALALEEAKQTMALPL